MVVSRLKLVHVHRFLKNLLQNGTKPLYCSTLNLDGKRFYYTKIIEIVEPDQVVEIGRGWPYQEGKASSVAFARIVIESVQTHKHNYRMLDEECFM